MTIGSTLYRVNANSTSVEELALSSVAISTIRAQKSHRIDATVVATVDGGATTDRAIVIGEPSARTGVAIPSTTASRVSASALTVDAATSSGTTLTVTVRNSSGTPESKVTVRLTDGHGHALASSSGVEALTNAHGRASFMVRDAIAEDVHFVAAVAYGKANLVLGRVTVRFVAAVDATRSSITTLKASIPASGSATTTVTVTLRGSTGARVPNIVVELRATNGSAAKIEPARGIATNSRGEAVFSVADSHPGSVAFAGSYTDGGPPVTIAPAIIVTFTKVKTPPSSTTTSTPLPGKGKGKGKGKPKALTVDGAISSLSAAATQTAAASGTTITVTLRTSGDRGVAGRRVSLTSSSAASVSPSEVTTGTNGTATFKVNDSEARSSTTITFRARDLSDGVAIAQSVTVTFVPRDAPDPADSTMTASSATSSRGTSTATITVMVANANGRPIAGVGVALRSTSSAHAAQSSVTTNVYGLATFTVKDNATQSVSFTAFTTGSPPIDLGTVTVHFRT
jgi:hypothetical protein